MKQPAQLIAQAEASETRALGPELLALFGVVPAASGISITPASAMRCAPVRAAVEAISEALGCLPLHLYERGQNGARDCAEDHPAAELLSGDANEWTSAGGLREQLTRDALLHGNGFAAIVWDGTGTPRELHRLDPAAVQIERDQTSGEPIYRLTTGKTANRILDRRDVLHIAAPSVDGIRGASPVQDCKEAIALALALERYAANLFGNGGRPSGILSFPNKLTDDSAKRMKGSWQAATAGANAGATAVLEEGGSFTPLAFSSVDAQCHEMRQFAVAEIARIFRVPPVSLMDYSRQTWSNAETGGQQFLTHTLDRWLRVWTEEIRLKLIDRADRARIYAEFLTDALLRSDFATRATAYGQYRSMGAMTANEVRKGLNLPPLPGGDDLSNPYTSTSTTPAPGTSTEPGTEGGDE
ncbi:phage portal protein [Paracoccus sp. IB05]|uniref:phage portal protein n=1 Tax=Paracoccus sp. IB05 TaxID=2779367 RepID=UPI0018E8BCA7|nr:phage portal protein [Paracoccus sp. IB05]MBJ2154081.1 phage portal protein [Paracoccus sp. IB05]